MQAKLVYWKLWPSNPCQIVLIAMYLRTSHCFAIGFDCPNCCLTHLIAMLPNWPWLLKRIGMRPEGNSMSKLTAETGPGA